VWHCSTRRLLGKPAQCCCCCCRCHCITLPHHLTAHPPACLPASLPSPPSCTPILHPAAEIIKRRIVGLHQDTAISSVELRDHWEPKEEGLDPIETTRHVSVITITLSKVGTCGVGWRVAGGGWRWAGQPLVVAPGALGVSDGTGAGAGCGGRGQGAGGPSWLQRCTCCFDVQCRNALHHCTRLQPAVPSRAPVPCLVPCHRFLWSRRRSTPPPPAIRRRCPRARCGRCMRRTRTTWLARQTARGRRAAATGAGAAGGAGGRLRGWESRLGCVCG
jgi:hypothetical protein